DNKPTPQEITTCRDFLKTAVAEMANLRAVIALGRIAHDSIVLASGGRRSPFSFAHWQMHALPALAPLARYHCSPSHTHTGVLTPQMFRDVIAAARKLIDAQPAAMLATTP